ncbi:DUF5681 domain-containing protein [Methylobacterium frigidaeris]|uniref:DUF5681 domain-containing protein n=1 Tax=Methylobacterium frigidaeris TaxID=2038277 RepID=A0AA37M6N7_9HYPH|nr:DUF5681 domain-containing protein [Methylobacterium frigidaeris]GJD63986.1 hypothetical protein MPEAHAMD_4160 [Methylobacterium frigidaeris]
MSEHRSKRPRADHPAEYEVGYGRPPRASQFKPGQCGNPRGRPTKPKSLQAALERELDRAIVVREAGRERRLSKREVITRRVVDDACRGDARALRLVRDITGSVASAQGASADPGPAAAAPPDSTDQAIIAAFAAIIRAGATLPTDDGPPALQPRDPGESSLVLVPTSSRH